jgi:hypothetical protein
MSRLVAHLLIYGLPFGMLLFSLILFLREAFRERLPLADLLVPLGVYCLPVVSVLLIAVLSWRSQKAHDAASPRRDRRSRWRTRSG